LAAYQELKTEIDAVVHRVLDSGWCILGQQAYTAQGFSSPQMVSRAVEDVIMAVKQRSTGLEPRKPKG
jgi:hypothetical protein